MLPLMCHAMLCYAMPCRAMPYAGVPCHAVLVLRDAERRAMPECATPLVWHIHACRAMPCHATPCVLALRNAGHAVPQCDMLMPCRAMPWPMPCSAAPNLCHSLQCSLHPLPTSPALLARLQPPAGRLANPAAFRQRVHDGGVEPEARPEAWKLLLGVHAPGATRAVGQRNACCCCGAERGGAGCTFAFSQV